MAGQALDVFERYALFQQVGNRRDAEGVRRQPAGQACVLQPALHHPANVDHVHRVLGELSRLLVGRPEEGSVLSGSPKTGCVDVLENDLLQVVTDRNLTALAALLVEVQHALVARMIKTAALEASHGAGAGGGVDEDGHNGAVAELYYAPVTIEASSFLAPSTVISGVLPSTTW